MTALSQIADAADARAKLAPLMEHYRTWLKGQKAKVPASPPRRHETGEELLKRAERR